MAATTAAVTELAAGLVADRIERVTVESTSDYWRIWFYLLEAAGLSKALVAVARSILVVVWNLLAHPDTRYRNLGPDYHARHIDTQRRVRNHLAQLAALGYRVTVEPAA